MLRESCVLEARVYVQPESVQLHGDRAADAKASIVLHGCHPFAAKELLHRAANAGLSPLALKECMDLFLAQRSIAGLGGIRLVMSTQDSE